MARKKMKLQLSRKQYIYAGAALGGILVIGVALYLLAQSLAAKVLEMQIKRAGYPQAEISGLHLYMDGIVIDKLKLDDKTELRELYTDQSAPSIAQNGVKQLIIRYWDQHVTDMKSLALNWPFPQIKRVSIENMQLKMDLPLQDIMLQGTVKSLQSDDHNIALLMPFAIEKENYHLSGNMEIALYDGKIETIDFNLEDGSYHDENVMLKRLNGWMNIQLSAEREIKTEAQFTSGSVHYQGNDFADGMAQYSYASGQSGQWTVTLNHPSQDYFNTWVIKETTRPGRYAVQIAAQMGKDTKTRTMVSGLPLVLQLLAPGSVQ
ncbi:MAG TPA: hypothetical protein VGF14_01020 [Alphaproteobacteria bacterium]